MGNINQMVHSNIVQDPTEINLDAEILALQSVLDQDVSSKSSRLIPECVNLWISILRIIKIIQEILKKLNDIPKVFGLVYLFESVAMTANKSIIPEIEIFASKLIHH